eukprot:12867269-Alexandrium_andersonii.AAC.1
MSLVRSLAAAATAAAAKDRRAAFTQHASHAGPAARSSLDRRSWFSKQLFAANTDHRLIVPAGKSKHDLENEFLKKRWRWNFESVQQGFMKSSRNPTPKARYNKVRSQRWGPSPERDSEI